MPAMAAMTPAPTQRRDRGEVTLDIALRLQKLLAKQPASKW